jgi:tight adherence protein B
VSGWVRVQDIPLLILALLVFLSIFFLIRGLFLFLGDPKRRTRQRLKQRLRELEGREAYPDFNTLLKKASLEKTFLDRNIDKFRMLHRIETLMHQANLTWRLETFLAVVALAGLVGLGAGLAKWGALGGLAGLALGLFLPYKFLTRRRRRRMQKFERQLPDALDLLARGLKAGQTLPAGLQQVSKEMPDPLGTEFLITFMEFSHGMDLNRALTNLCSRVDLRDLSFFATAVVIQRETGGNLTEILEKISVLIRERFKLRNQVKSLTAEGRLSGMILVLLPPVLGIILMVINPGYEMQLIRHPVGRVMCGVGAGFQLMGILLIYKIVNIKV